MNLISTKRVISYENVRSNDTRTLRAGSSRDSKVQDNCEERPCVDGGSFSDCNKRGRMHEPEKKRERAEQVSLKMCDRAQMENLSVWHFQIL